MHYTLSSFALYFLKTSCWLLFPNYNWFWYFWTIGFFKKCYYKTLSRLFTTFKFSFTSLMFLNSSAAVNSSRRSIHDWTVILDILFVPLVILISSSPCVYLNFSNQPFDAVNVAKSSLFNFLRLTSLLNSNLTINLEIHLYTFFLGHANFISQLLLYVSQLFTISFKKLVFFLKSFCVS